MPALAVDAQLQHTGRPPNGHSQVGEAGTLHCRPHTHPHVQSNLGRFRTVPVGVDLLPTKLFPRWPTVKSTTRRFWFPTSLMADAPHASPSGSPRRIPA